MTGGTAVTVAYAELPNKLVRAANGVGYAYREAGDGGVPLVLLQHFRGNLDSWDPALIDALASGRRVVTFDNTGVGGSSGQTPDTVGQMARDAIAFITALGLGQVDILGFSIGSFVAQNDEAIPPDVERMFAARMGATTVEVPASHVAMVSHPQEVADLIAKAAAAVGNVAVT